jgi:hypothetical protein
MCAGAKELHPNICSNICKCRNLYASAYVATLEGYRMSHENKWKIQPRLNGSSQCEFLPDTSSWGANST